MALLNLTLDLKRTAEAISSLLPILTRIADSLDRLAPPLLDVSSTEPYRAPLADVHTPGPDYHEPIQTTLQEFAQERNIIVNSEAFLQSIIEYERAVASAYGEEALRELPWNKAAGALLFSGRSTGSAGTSAGSSRSASDQPQNGARDPSR